MPPPATTCTKNSSTDLKIKKTKSRNGCSRCKLKRLKCDETTPGCLQCKKRNAPCPGYEKTLKWSTKYEVLQPTPGGKPCSRPAPEIATTDEKAKQRTTSPEVERHFQALAAVLPAGKKDLERTQKDTSVEAPTTEVLTFSEESSPEPRDLSSPEFEVPLDSFPVEDHVPIDPIILDCLGDGVDMPISEWSFDDLEGFNVDPGPTKCTNVDAEGIDLMEDDASPSVLSSSPRLSRSLLLDFYRLPSPSPSTTAVDSTCLESVLVQHYFKDICVLFSSFDSGLNPFRTIIGRVCQNTPSIYFAIQSMSAAHLSNTFPTMAGIGKELQRKARDALNQELSGEQGGQADCTKPLLTLMLLGLTTSWHEPSDLGDEFLSTARSLIFPRLISNSDGEIRQRNIQFFEECLIYWEMLMGFVNKDSIVFAPTGLRSRGTGKKAPAAKPDGQVVPHPWTGIAPAIHILFAEVGRLVRRESALNTSNCAKNMRHSQENLHNATTLEEDLLGAEFPSVEEIADFGDGRTSKQDFVVMAKAYRCAGLLELYRTFPSILRKRLGGSWTDNVDFQFPSPRFETPYEETDIKLWLNSLAMHILDLIKSIPTSSGTICTQQILLVTAASELRFASSVDFFDVYANDVKVLKARNFAINRLQEHALRLPAKPIMKQIDHINEVWRRQDNPGSLWTDLLDDNEWQTLMI
ncbi:hypothetical protein DM02DRAFT_623060 [Periconia macrospinosa]|uniref:Zn(2)-C6 fungal-type domain-containing protein n=1 Tax=Periconia macrospinosa TaxID=97972 RepID=A0A2V1E8W6_9PLEO|nr:hypothetical protein DM02DRAFT_623060 [Periconia macrospinosa]